MKQNTQEKLHIPLTEKLKSIPDVFGIRLNEEPRYKVIRRDGNVELRHYESQLHARVTLAGLPFNSFREAAFPKLAAYIFGENTRRQDMAPEVSGESIGMTAPVIEEKSGAGFWTMAFVLPAKFNLSNAPKPHDSAIKLVEVPAYDAAVISYSGSNSLASIHEHEAELKAWIKSQKTLAKIGHFFSAQYDGPFAISFLRRNEVQVKVKGLSS